MFRIIIKNTRRKKKQNAESERWSTTTISSMPNWQLPWLDRFALLHRACHLCLHRNRTGTRTLYSRRCLVSIISRRSWSFPRCILSDDCSFFMVYSVGVSWLPDQVSWEQTSKCHSFNRRIWLVSSFVKPLQFTELLLLFFSQSRLEAKTLMSIRVWKSTKLLNSVATATWWLVSS